MRELYLLILVVIIAGSGPVTADDGALSTGSMTPDNCQIMAGAISFRPVLVLAEERPLLPVFNLLDKQFPGQLPVIPAKIEPGRIIFKTGYDIPGAAPSQPDLLSVLKDIFQSEGVPHAFIWLAEVESAMDPEAESSAGALGLFQLMPDTAKRFGLRIAPVDDRKTPEKSARAAAAYLRYLRGEFGCWSLALAAYNAGEGRVSRTMKSRKTRTFHELAPYLPAETRRYVPRVMTTIALREDQRRGVPAAICMP